MAKKKTAPAKKTDSTGKQSFKKRISAKRVTKRQNKAAARKSHAKLSSAFNIFRDSVSLMRQHWRLFFGIAAAYLLVTTIMVGGFGAGDYNVEDLKTDFSQEIGEGGAAIASFGNLVGSTGSASTQAGSVYQTVLGVVFSLAIIWTLRQLLAGKKVTTRDAYYQGMYPLVPFVLVLVILGVLLVPAVIGSFLFSSIINSGLTVNLIEMVTALAVVIGFMMISLYLVASYIFAIFIVTLPDARPLSAIQISGEMTRYRRWTIIRKLLFLPVSIIFLAALLMIPLITIMPFVVTWVFIIFGALSLQLAHVYAYHLYREML